MALLSLASFVDGLFESQLLDAEQREEVRRLTGSAAGTRELARELLRRDLLTAYQINQILHGQGDGLTLGPYVLLRRVGEGGMGQVYKAKQKALDRIVALKVIRKECLDNPKVVLRFQREIRAASQLKHANIVRAYDADQVDGTWYFAMEYIDGVDLGQLVKEQGPLPMAQACDFIRQAALGLQHAHERGLVHRDIKPANLLVTNAVAADRRRSSGLIPRPRDLKAKRPSSSLPRVETKHYPWGVVKILDMGLARYDDPWRDQNDTNLTQVGAVMGTPEFIAPEQARDSHNCDIRSDLYSLGCTFYFLLAGQTPFPYGTPTDKLLMHQFNEPESVQRARRDRIELLKARNDPAAKKEIDPRVPTAIMRIVRRLLAKRPEDRLQTPIELAEELQQILFKLADGTLPLDDAENESTEELPVIELPEELPSSTPNAKTKQSPRKRNRSRLRAFALTGLGIGAALLIVTMLTVLIGRGFRTQAAPASKDGPSNSKSLRH